VHHGRHRGQRRRAPRQPGSQGRGAALTLVASERTRPDPSPARVGVYIHIPFCSTRCDYCAFATWTDREHLIGDYVDALVTDVTRTFAEPGAPAAVSSVFFGGGTPSLLPGDELVRVLAAVPRRDDAEVTVECNPDTVTPDLLATYVAGGVNRVSFGVQSMVPHVLRALGRTHDIDNVTNAVAAARSVGLDSFNLDIMYGGAGESLEDWTRTVDAVLALEPPHVSAYGLTVEAGTPLAADASRHPDDDDQADKYLAVTERFAAAGLEWYEISNWARPGHECRHNLLYWSQGNYLAFGAAAHGHLDGTRFWNVRTPERYIDAVREGRSPVAGREELTTEVRRAEARQLALRTTAGVPLEALPVGDEAAALDGLLAVQGDRAVLTVAGRLLANEVAIRLR
jgi:putative oxygen-independent coproporphyrinogen III oxidase